MVQSRVGNESKQGLDSTGFGVETAKNDPPDPRVHKGACTHWTGFLCDEYCCLYSPLLDFGRRGAEGHDFGMGDWIAVDLAAIAASANNLLAKDDHGANGNVPSGGSGTRFFKRKTHPMVVGLRHFQLPPFLSRIREGSNL